MKRSLIILACALCSVTFFTGCKDEKNTENDVVVDDGWFQGKTARFNLKDIQSIDCGIEIRVHITGKSYMTMNEIRNGELLFKGPITEENIRSVQSKLRSTNFERIFYSTTIKLDNFEVELPKPKLVNGSLTEDAVIEMLDAWLKFVNDLQTRIDRVKYSKK